MLKLLGSVMIIVAGTGIGFKAGEALARQNDLLGKMKKMIILLRGEIKYNNSYLGQALENVAEKTEEPYRTFLLHLSAKLEENNGQTFGSLWRKTVMEELGDCGLQKKQLDRFSELGDTLGFLDKEMQLAAFDLFLEQLEQLREENSVKIKENSRLYRCLGVMGGIVLVLLIT